MPKKNPMLEKLEAQYELKYRLLFNKRMRLFGQMCEDAAMMAAHRTLQLGKGRAKGFHNEYVDAVNRMAEMICKDSLDDPDFEYAKAKIDAELCSIVGEENFTPWEKRYYGG